MYNDLLELLGLNTYTNPISNLLKILNLKNSSKNNNYGYGLRQDKTKKGKGFFGEIPLINNQGIMTELGSETDIDGERIYFPLIVPSLTYEEIQHLAQGNEPTEEIWNKAIEFALKRKSEGKPYFATQEEEGKTPIPINKGKK